MICWRCKTKMNKTIFESVVIDYCKCCGGIWLDKNELNKIIFKSSKLSKEQLFNQIKNEIKSNSLVYAVSVCPKCSKEKLKTKFIGNVLVDYCQKCNGIFFDKNELNKILDYYNNLSWIKKIFLMFKKI